MLSVIVMFMSGVLSVIKLLFEGAFIVEFGDVESICTTYELFKAKFPTVSFAYAFIV